MHKKSHQFFHELQRKLGKGKDVKRFLQELHDHVEDKKEEEKLQNGYPHARSSASSPASYLGDPGKLTRQYKKVFFSDQIRYAFASVIFLTVFTLVEMFPLFAEGHYPFWVDVLSMIGFFLYLFALPVMYFNILLGGLTFFVFGVDVNSTDFYRFAILPLLVASFYTFLYFVFFCKPFWKMKGRRTKTIAHS